MKNKKKHVISGVAVSVVLFLSIPISIRAQVAPAVKSYKVEEDLENVVNLKYFKEAVNYYTRRAVKGFSFSDAQKKKLVQNGFVVTPSNAEQFFHIYESLHYGISPRIPNFITSDCVLQLYHLFYDFTLRAIEVDELLPALTNLTRAMLSDSIKQYQEITSPALKTACLKNISFFGVAAKLLGIEVASLPQECASQVQNELQKIEKHQSRENSSIFPWQHDYTQYIVRGHYTRSEELQKFFMVMMWYGQNPFPFEYEGERTEQQILQALLITHLLLTSTIDSEALIGLWEKVYSITALYVGSTDDLNVHHFGKLMEEAYGKSPPPDALADKEKLDLFYENSKKLTQPRIVGTLLGIPSGLQFRFMGQRFIPDSYIMQELVSWPARPWPKGLDVMAVLGSKQASLFLDTLYQEPEKWEGYLPRRKKLEKEFANMDEKEWYQNLFYGWLYTLQALLEKRGKGYPSFMQNTAWEDKELNTALASWAELRHDTILYGKPSGAEGDGPREEVPQPKGYVEPVPEFYNRLIKLVRLNKKILSDCGYFSEKIKKIADRYEDLLRFLRKVSQKELQEIPLNPEEYERIRRFGGTMEGLSISMVELEYKVPLRGWFEVTGPDQEVACIADVHTSSGKCLEEAVGHINPIYVVVPIEGKLHLTRGGVFSYYEFKYPADRRLTDEAWQEMIKRGRAPDPPSWTSSFTAD